MQIILIVFASQKVAHYFMLYTMNTLAINVLLFFFKLKKKKSKTRKLSLLEKFFFKMRKPQKDLIFALNSFQFCF